MNSLTLNGALPKGWHLARFDEFLHRIERKIIIDDSSFYDCVGVRWYGMGAFIREREIGMNITRKQQWVLKAGDIIYNKLFAWKNAFAIADDSVDGCIVSDKFPTYEADTNLIDPQFLHYYFRMANLGKQALDLSKGGAAISKLTLNPPQFWDLTVPLPPLEEQRRIVARIEELAAKIGEARGLRREALEEAKRVLQAARRKLIGERASADWLPLKTYVAQIENGWSPACENRSAIDEEWGVLKLGAVSFGTYNELENKALPPTLEPKPEYEIRSGDFLMSRANTTDLVGACVLVEKTRPNLMLSDKIFRFLFKEKPILNHLYLEQVFKSPALRAQIEKGATGTSQSMKNISKEKVLSLLIPPHDETEQSRIVDYLDELQSKVDMLKRKQAESSAELDALLPSVLDKAFKGEL